MNNLIKFLVKKKIYKCKYYKTNNKLFTINLI